MPTTARKLDLAAAATRLSLRRVQTQERRRFRRLPIAVTGRMLGAGGQEHDCRTADMSPGDVRIITPDAPPVGQQVVLYLDGFGRVSGKVARKCGEGEVAVIFDFSAHKREKLAEQLTLAINQDLGIEQPAHRIVPREPARTVRIEHGAGDAYEGEVVDFSLTGVTIHTRRTAPPIGAWVRIGGVYGRVARMIEGGFAVDFDPRGQRPQS
ncbi:MAG: PilZ domain-containing protein [Proteobacteria bacterium]|nr:PilZ domain-containing protein [Pseudomonadota bacterium]